MGKFAAHNIKYLSSLRISTRIHTHTHQRTWLSVRPLCVVLNALIDSFASHVSRLFNNTYISFFFFKKYADVIYYMLRMMPCPFYFDDKEELASLAPLPHYSPSGWIEGVSSSLLFSEHCKLAYSFAEIKELSHCLCSLLL